MLSLCLLRFDLRSSKLDGNAVQVLSNWLSIDRTQVFVVTHLTYRKEIVAYWRTRVPSYFWCTFLADCLPTEGTVYVFIGPKHCLALPDAYKALGLLRIVSLGMQIPEYRVYIEFLLIHFQAFEVQLSIVHHTSVSHYHADAISCTYLIA